MVFAMNNKELTESEIRKIALEIEEKHLDLSDEDWFKIVQFLASRADCGAR